MGREGKLLLRGIGEGITEDDESRRPAELLVAAAMEMGANGARVWGREAGRARELEGRGSGRPVRIRMRGTRFVGGDARHAARGTMMADAWTRATRASPAEAEERRTVRAFIRTVRQGS